MLVALTKATAGPYVFPIVPHKQFPTILEEARQKRKQHFTRGFPGDGSIEK